MNLPPVDDVIITKTVETRCTDNRNFHCTLADGHSMHCHDCHKATLDPTLFRQNKDGTVSWR